MGNPGFDHVAVELSNPEDENLSEKHELAERAVSTILKVWSALPQESIASFFAENGQVYTRARGEYPEGSDALFGFGYRFPEGARFFLIENEVTIQTVTRQTLDGQSTGEPFEYSGWEAISGWIHTKDLTLGTHTVQVTTEYEITHQGRPVTKGVIKSGPILIEILPSTTPDHLAAAPNPELDQQVREAIRISDVRMRDSVYSGNYLNLPDPYQSSGRTPDGSEFTVRLPAWELTEALPVDLAFEVEWHLEDTGEILHGSPLLVLKGQKSWGHFSPKNMKTLLDGHEGEISLRIVLKPSRDNALTNESVTEYYNGPAITSDVVRANVMHFKESDANPVVLRLREMYTELTGLERPPRTQEEREALLTTGIDSGVLYYIGEMTALNPYKRRNAASGLSNPPFLEGDVTHLIPFLVKLLDDPADNGGATDAARALGRIGEHGIPPLVDALKHENPSIRRSAASAIGSMGGSGGETITPSVVGPLLEHLDDANARVREAVAYALYRFPDERAVVPLIRALDDEIPEVRAYAAMALGLIKDSQATPRLIKAFRTDDAQVRGEALNPLGRLGDPAAVELLLEALDDETANIWRDAADWLGYIGEPQAIPPLVQALREDSAEVKRAAARALGQLEADEAIESLVKSLDSKDENLRKITDTALKKITGLDPGANQKKWREWLPSLTAALSAAEKQASAQPERDYLAPWIDEIGKWQHTFDSIAIDPSNMVWLIMRFQEDMSLIRIIEEGRRDPGRVGPIVVSALRESMRNFPVIYLAGEERRLRKLSGIAVEAGSGAANASQVWQKNAWAGPFGVSAAGMSAALWVLANIGYTDAIDDIADYATLLSETPVIYPEDIRDYAATLDNAAKTYRAMTFQKAAPAMAVFALDALLSESNDPRYDEQRAILAKGLRGRSATDDKRRLKGSKSLLTDFRWRWHLQNYPPESQAPWLDESSTEWIDVYVPDTSSFHYNTEDYITPAQVVEMMEAIYASLHPKENPQSAVRIGGNKKLTIQAN